MLVTLLGNGVGGSWGILECGAVVWGCGGGLRLGEGRRALMHGWGLQELQAPVQQDGSAWRWGWAQPHWDGHPQELQAYSPLP